LAPLFKGAVQGDVNGTTTSFPRPVPGQPAVADVPNTAAIFVAMKLAKVALANTAEFFAAAISAVMLFGVGIDGKLPAQMALGASGF